MMEASLVQLLTVLALKETVTAENRITAVEGDHVTLQCRLDPPVDVSALTVDWKRVDNKRVVHTYRHGRDLPDAQAEQYRGRTALNHEDLKRGVVTLLLSSAQLSDSGPYRCFIPKRNAGCTMDLNVEAVKTDGTETSDSTPTGPSLEDMIHPHDHDGVNWRAICAGVIPVLVVIPSILISGLIMRRRMSQDEEVEGDGGTSTTDEACQLKKLNPPTAAAEGEEGKKKTDSETSS